MKSTEIAALLRNVPYFASLDDELLESIAEQAVVEDFGADDVIIEAGTPGEGLGVLVEGEVQAHRGERKFKDLATGDYMGDMSLLDGAPHAATFSAKTDGRWIIVSPAQFRAAVMHHPAVGQAVIDVLMERLRETLRWLEEADSENAALRQQD